MRYSLLIAAALTLAIALIPGASAASADKTCNPGQVCAWDFYGFEQGKGESLCTGGVHYMARVKLSAKNRCPNKAVWLRLHETHLAACLNPEQQISGVEFTDIWVGVEGSRC